MPRDEVVHVRQHRQHALLDRLVGVEAAVRVPAKTLSAAAKTGTADFSPGLNNAWFTAYAPYDQPRFAVTVVIDLLGAAKIEEEDE